MVIMLCMLVPRKHLPFPTILGRFLGEATTQAPPRLVPVPIRMVARHDASDQPDVKRGYR